MRGSSLGYLIKKGISNIWLNRMMSAASMGILTACLIIVGGSGLLAVNIRDIFTAIENQNEMVIFIKEDATEEDVTVLGDKIDSLDHVSDYYYVSKAEALEEQKEYMGEKGYLLDGLEDDNPLPASYRLTLSGLEYLNETVEQLQHYRGVDTISAPTDLADTLTGVEKTALVLGSIIIGILIVASTVVISNTIRLTLFARRREINIMRYVGATNGFIRLPFVVEGMTIGIFSAVLAFGVIWAIYQSLGSLFAETRISWLTSVSNNLIPFMNLWYYVLGGFLIAGILIGSLSSSSSIRRYLKV
ncbi:MAG: permease-like cell division protein FtsX [Oscillospiraceae bacterium]|nr:permease-like cell division protein FtsX [Oscillospiraceae bacterium]